MHTHRKITHENLIKGIIKVQYLNYHFYDAYMKGKKTKLAFTLPTHKQPIRNPTYGSLWTHHHYQYGRKDLWDCYS